MLRIKIPILLCIFWLTSHGQEICNNSIDDDGDGLVDCYDNDCYSTDQCISTVDAFYYGLMSADTCSFKPEKIDGSWDLITEWSTDIGAFGNIANAPLVGDLDNDGIPEVVLASGWAGGLDLGELSIFNGQTGTLLRAINFGYSKYVSPLIADINNDGFGEIIFKNSNSSLVCYSYTSDNILWTSPPNGFNAIDEQINIADLNGDGVAEIFDRKRIWNAQTGELLGVNLLITSEQHPILAADVLPDSSCSNCEGLELIVGDHIFSVQVSDTALFNIEQKSDFKIALPRNTSSSVSDINGDGQLEVVSKSSDYFYIWDSQTGEIIDSISTSRLPIGNIRMSFLSPPVINDIDNDGEMEYLIGCQNDTNSNIGVLIALESDLSYMWSESSLLLEASILPVIFDLDGDGLKEIVIRTQYHSSSSTGHPYLYILSANDGVKKDSIYMEHSTRSAADNSVVIADVDADGEVEIVVTGKLNPSTDMQVCALSSNSGNWVCGRRVWNQINYHPTLVNDNLSIPRVPQNYALLPKEYNGNSIQASFKDVNGNYACHTSPDATAELEATNYISCDSIQIDYKICNRGNGRIHEDSIIPHFVSFYKEDPRQGGSLLYTDIIYDSLYLPGTCLTHSRKFKVEDTSYHIFIVANDSAISFSTLNLYFNECNKENNFAEVIINPSSMKLSISPEKDTFLLGSTDNIQLTARGADSYLWNDQSTDSTIMVAPNTTTQYCVTGLDTLGCEATVCATVYVNDELCNGKKIFIPNIITPNGDLANDKLCINVDCVSNTTLKIYNKIGELIYQSIAQNNCWEAYRSGTLVETGVYSYLFLATDHTGNHVHRKGNITVAY